MKKSYIMMAAALMMVAGCKEKIQDTHDRTPVDIEVSFTLNGEQISEMDVNAMSKIATFDVKLNNDNLNWNLVSDSPWCEVIEASHKGSGPVQVHIKANEDFAPRPYATLQFMAGVYEGPRIEIRQESASFVVSQAMEFSGANGSTHSLEVVYMKEQAWRIEAPEWLTVEKEASTNDYGELAGTRLNITVAENQGLSRLGSIKLYKEGSSEPGNEISVWQFGSELEYNENNEIVISGQQETSLSFLAPTGLIESLTLPAYATYTSTENSDGTTQFTITFESNVNDCMEVRTPSILAKLTQGVASASFPSLRQEFYPVNGLCTARGLTLFAQAVNAGESYEAWCKNGEVVLLNSIDMTSIKDWKAIGTEEHPFKGKFNAGYRKISGLNAKEPIFGVCEDAEIIGLTVDGGTVVNSNSSIIDGIALAGLAGVIRNTTITDCNNTSSITLTAGISGSGELVSYIGGLVGLADDNSVLTGCVNEGTITGSSKFALGQGKSHLGGIVGMISKGGRIENCVNYGLIAADEKDSPAATVGMGGICGTAQSGDLKDNVNSGNIQAGGNITNLYAGGLYGLLTADTAISEADKSNSKCNINLTTLRADLSTSSHNAGGYVGATKASLTIEGKDNDGIVSYKPTEALKGAHLSLGGFLGLAMEDDDDERQDLCVITLKNCTNDAKVILESSSSNTLIITDVALGGIVGFSNVGVIAEGCRNNGNIDNPSSGTCSSAKSNGYITNFGGIVGKIQDGDSQFISCLNFGTITNLHYNNNAYKSGSSLVSSGNPSTVAQAWKFNSSAGIIASFNAINDGDAKIIIKDCYSGGAVESYRGAAANIAGFARNATISGCTGSGIINDVKKPARGGLHSPMGGIVGILLNGSVTSCTANSNLRGGSAGSIAYCGGGIVGWGENAAIKDCAFYGNLIQGASTYPGAEYNGAIIGFVDADCVVDNCKMGGSMTASNTTSPQIGLTEDNYMNYIVGRSGIITPTNCSYWAGE